MEFVVVAAAALFTSALTMYSGFGLGTLLLPVFALFFPVDMAVAATALVHGANNVLKALLLGKLADRRVVLRFGIPAILAAFIGAWLLAVVSKLSPIATYELLGKAAVITPIKLVLSVLMLAFSALELHPRFEALQFDSRHLPAGGALSGFFGGLSGHQGAFRSAFLAKAGITPESFVGTNALIALLVDLTRLSVYGAVLFGGKLPSLAGTREGWIIATGTLAAFTGVIVAKKFLHKVTMKAVQRLTGGLLICIALLLGSGII